MNSVKNRNTATEASIASLHTSLLAGDLSGLDIIDRCLERVEKWDSRGPKLKAILAVNSQARDIAAQQDVQLAASQTLSGPLHGIPIMLKDNCNTSTMPTTAGSLALQAFTPARDSAVARRLTQAGAIILGKANLHEFALAGTTVSSLGGQTRNPYDLRRTPGGSSGGSGVAVAMDFCTVAIGTDTVNSIRSPASANCVTGLRPTRGLISRAGIIPVTHTQDTVGPMARTVADIARVMDVLAGYDPDDSVTAHCVGKTPSTYVDSLDPDAMRGRRLGILPTFQGSEERHEEVNHAMSEAVDVMRCAGAEVVIVDDPFLAADSLLNQLDIQKWEFRGCLNGYLQAEPDATVRSLADIIDSGRYHKSSLEAFLAQAETVTDRLQDLEYLRRLAAINDLRDRLFNHMAAQNLDAMIYPLQRCLVAPIEGSGQPERNGILAALTGFPALNVPAGFSKPTPQAPLGVPIGLDFLARPFDEPLLLGLGYAFEQLTGFRRPPILSD